MRQGETEHDREVMRLDGYRTEHISRITCQQWPERVRNSQAIRHTC